MTLYMKWPPSTTMHAIISTVCDWTTCLNKLPLCFNSGCGFFHANATSWLAVLVRWSMKCMWTVVGIQLLCEYAHLSKRLVQASIHTHTCQCNPTSLELIQACPNYFPAQFRVVTSSSAPTSKTRLSDHAITTLKCIVCEDCQIVCMNNQWTTSPL